MKTQPTTMKDRFLESFGSFCPAMLLWVFCVSPTDDAVGAVVAGDDFEPDIDQFQWAAFGGTVLATNYGGSVSGANALCFEFPPRFATTRPWDTRGGGRIEFYLRFTDGYDN